jgi:hypothetical protein
MLEARVRALTTEYRDVGGGRIVLLTGARRDRLLT